MFDRCHGTASEWNGHWTYSDMTWKIIKGARAYLINREPHSAHITMLEKEDFKILCDKKVRSKSKISRKSLTRRFSDISDDDLTTSGAFIQAVKRGKLID